MMAIRVKKSQMIFTEDNGWGGSAETESADESTDNDTNMKWLMILMEPVKKLQQKWSHLAAVMNPHPDTAENTWGTPDTTDSVVWENDSDGMNSEGATEIPSEPSTGDSDTEQEGGDAQPDAGWGTADEVQTCASQSDCSEERVCAATGQCLFPDDFGTTLEGEECATTDQCAISLTCTEGVCAQEESTTDDEE